MHKLATLIKNYWLAEETNIFKNYKDALAGFIVLVALPAASIYFTMVVEKYTFWSYTFPFLSIALAGLYDTYGRFEGKSSKNPKLAVRAILNFMAIFFAALGINEKSVVLPYITPTLLCLSGLLLIFEIYYRIKRAVLISPWIID